MKIYIIVNGHISNLLVIKRWRSGSLQPFEPSYSLCARHRFSSNVASVFRMGPWVIDCCLTSRLWWCLLWTHGWIGPHYTGVTCSSISTYFPGFKITSFYPYLLMLLASPKAAKTRLHSLRFDTTRDCIHKLVLRCRWWQQWTFG